MGAGDDEAAGAGDDKTIVSRVRDGNTNAFAKLVDRYQRQVLALGYRFFRDREEAEDFAQEVFLQAFRKLDTFEGTGRFFSWLMRIAYTMGGRKAGRATKPEAYNWERLVDPAPRPDQALERTEAKRAVVEAIQQLPEGYADCIALYFFFDLTYEEVGVVTGFPLNTVRSHIRRGKRLLAAYLTDKKPADDNPAAGGSGGDV